MRSSQTHTAKVVAKSHKEEKTKSCFFIYFSLMRMSPIYHSLSHVIIRPLNPLSFSSLKQMEYDHVNEVSDLTEAPRCSAVGRVDEDLYSIENIFKLSFKTFILLRSMILQLNSQLHFYMHDS